MRNHLDRFAAIPELAGRDVLALDGHDVKHATHEPPATMASGRREVPDTVTGVFLRNLRSGAARVLAQTEGHQHEWAAVKGRPWSDFLWHPQAKGTMGITLRMAGYKDKSITVALDENSSISVDLERMEVAPPKVMVKPAVPRAELRNPSAVQKSPKSIHDEEDEWRVH